MKLWELPSATEIAVPSGGLPTRGAVGVMEWLSYEEGIEILLCGTNAGVVFVWRRPDSVRAIVDASPSVI